MKKAIEAIKENKEYLVGGVLGTIVGIVLYFIWKLLIYLTFGTEYLITLTLAETILSDFALIGMATSIWIMWKITTWLRTV